jgi:hypothetical protein
MPFSEAEPRDGIYIWVTWLTKLLAGESACEWALWFRARHKYDKLPRGFDLEKWIREHDELVAYRAEQLRRSGYEVFLEDQNSFSVRSSRSGATIAGKPDIVALRQGEALLEDCKTGRKRDSDHVQVALYLLLSPHLTPFKTGVALTGQVTYPDGTISLNTSKGDRLGERLGALVSRICEPQPPTPTASVSECGYCDISDFYCESRISSGSNRVYVTDVF